METYIVRIYRNDPSEVTSVAGLIEKVETEQKIAFQDMAGLQSVLTGFIEDAHVDTASKRRLDKSARLNMRMSTATSC